MEERDFIALTNYGKKIFGVIHRPIRNDKYPFVIICSGFGGSKCGKNRLFVRLAEQLTSLGIGVLRFDYRGCGDSEGDYKDQTFEDHISDTLLYLNYIENNFNIDKSRIGILGRSLGGPIAVITAARTKKIKSLALWAPIFSSEPWKRLWKVYEKGNFSQEEQGKIQRFSSSMPNKSFINEFFELNMENMLKKLDNVPILHIEGKKDTVVTEEHTLLYRAAREKNEKTKFLSLAESDHDFSNIIEQEIAIKTTCDWFIETLN